VPGTFLIAAAALLASVPAPLPLPGRLAFVLTAERVVLPAPVRATDLVVDSLAGSLTLRRVANPKVLAARLAAVAGQLCPLVRATDSAVTLTCRSKRIDARLMVERGRTTLIIEELRGLPWRNESDRLPMFYDPELFDLGGPCPGTTPAGRGECLLKQGRTAEAETQLQEAVENPDLAAFATLRLGDVAMGKDDPTRALEWYRRTGKIGLFGRLAILRVCEIVGDCSPAQWQDPFLRWQPGEPIRTEVRLRQARMAAYDGRLPQAVDLLNAALGGRPGACSEIGMMMCRRVMLVALTTPDRATGVKALEAYLQLPNRGEGPLAVELVRAAADRAELIGAPVFGGSLLAASASWVESGALAEHLLRNAELYLIGGDSLRARVVVEYAEAQFPASRLTGTRWALVRAQARAGDDLAAAEHAVSAYQTLATDSARDLAAANEALARARAERP
jgi:hypothetical protein